MPRLTVEGLGDFDVPQGKRLVLALGDEANVDQLHTYGGFAGCTSCRVQFIAGEPDQMSVAEKSVLAARRLSGVRLTWIAHRASRPVLRFLLWSPWGRENDCGRQDLPGVAAPAFPRPFFPCFGAHRFRRQSPTALRNFREVTWAGPPPAQARPAAPHALAPRNAATPAAPAATSPQRARSH